MTETQTFLADYAGTGSEAAFQGLVTRYLGLVYSTAVRLVGGDAHLAKDVTQTVFIDLARKARTFHGHAMLGGWLHHHTVFVASTMMRGERRRRLRERQAVEMNTQPDHWQTSLAQLKPVLDEAIDQLGAEERMAILLRFFEQLDFSAVGEVLGGTEEAARKRVSRALEKLRCVLQQRGVSLSVAALGAALATEAVTAVPAGLGACISAGVLANAAAAAGTTSAFWTFMAMTKVKLALGTLVLAGVATSVVVQHGARETWRRENESLRQRITQLQSENASLAQSEARAKLMLRLPAPRMQPAALPAADSTNLNLQLRKDDKRPKLTAEQLEAYLKDNRRSRASLLAAYRLTDDPVFLKEAMQRFPNDPQVGFRAALDPGLPSDERQQWLDAFEKSAPNNGLANYLSANNYFNSGQTDKAVQELIAASGKPQLVDYTADDVESVKEAYLAAGAMLDDAEMPWR